MPGGLNKALPRQQQEQQPSKGHLVSVKEQIVALLLRTSATHVLFNVTVPGQSQTFSTALLGIYDEHSFIILDELTPEKGHLLVAPGDTVRLSGLVDGMVVRFKTQLIEVREKNGLAFYKATLPVKLYHRKQRSAPRLPSHNAGIIFHGLRGKGMSQILKGYISDLSCDGIGVILTEEVKLYPGEFIPSCIVTLPDESEIAFSLEVCFCQQKPQQETRLGGRFAQIDNESLQKINHLLNQMERDHLLRLNRARC